MHHSELQWVDYAVMVVYFGFVLGIGFALKRFMHTSSEFLSAARSIPAMVFMGIFMMPFYYGSRARSVPDQLSLRFDEKTRAFSAITFAVMTIMSSGISMYAMAAASSDQ